MSALQLDSGALSEQDNSFQINNYHAITQERWEKILQYRKKFFENDHSVPPCDEYMDPEIVASWIRARDNGVSPYTKLPWKVISQEEYYKILDVERQLIDFAAPFYNIFTQVAISFNGEITFNDRNGVTLIFGGRQVFGDKQPDFRSPTLMWGVLDESSVGTSAFSLCKQLRRPVQLLSPEHYCEALASSNILATAAPILDENGEFIACVNFAQPFNPPWHKYYQITSIQTLCVINALAMSIQNKLMMNSRLQDVQDHLKTTEVLLETMLNLVNEVFITVDSTGRIICINQEGFRLLKLEKGNTESRNIGDFFNDPSRLLNYIAAGEVVELEEKMDNGIHQQTVLINIKPVVNPDNGKVNMAVLKLILAGKNSYRNNKTGDSVKFTFEDIIGESSEMKIVKNKVKALADFPGNVLFIGESGTGKELFAQAIHNMHCPQGPFIAINCAAIPTNLIESELFGYEGGSFTGADRNGRPGKIELAQGGTLFLDEIGDMPLELQATLLRVLEDKQIMRIGGRRSRSIEFRVIAATNKDLYKMVKEKLFREDLFFRLSVFSVNIPPLRRRGEDLEILSQHFINDYCGKLGWKPSKISSSAMKVMKEYDWPGNVRQLENALIYAVSFSENKLIAPENLPDYILQDRSSCLEQTEKGIAAPSVLANGLPSLRDSEKSLIENAFKIAKYDVAMAACMVGISKTTMYRKLKEYGIKI